MRRQIIMILLIMFLSYWGEIKGEDTRQEIFDPHFRTLKVEKEGDFMSMPVLRLGSEDRIVITFDEIAEDNRYLSARLVHCNSDWQPSALVESEYLDGFNTIDIDDYAFSSNTFIHYVNYRLEIPTEDFYPKVSGNYVVQVYDRDNPDEIILQARFRAVETLAGIKGIVTSRTDRGFNDRYQQLELEIDCESFEIGNPYYDLKIEVMQNGRSSTSRIISSPLRIDGKKLIYAHQPVLIFPASNEYRRFESTSVRFPGMGVDSVKYAGSNYHVWLKPDYPRADHNYEYDQTQHGRFLIKEYNATDSNIGADYITVHFFLDTPELPEGDVYIDSEATNGNFDRRNKLLYNGRKGGYEIEIPLKQGAYNYQYVIKQSVNQPDSTSPIEGDKYETENEYNIYVYSRKPGERYDRLIGATTLYSR